MTTGTALLVGLALLVGNAFFVGAEFAVLSARRSSIEPLAESGNRRARTVLWAMEHVSLMLACAQLGVTVCSIGLGMVAEPAIAHALEAPLAALHVPGALVHPVAFAIALAIVVYLHVVLGEMVPKNLAVSGPDTAVMWFGPPLVWIARAVNPLIVVLNRLANVFVRLGGVEPRDEVASAFTAEQVHSIVEVSRQEGVLVDEQGLLAGSLEFSERVAREVMVPTDALTSLVVGATPDDVEHAVARTGFSRFPLVAAEGGPVTGYLHLKDVLYAGDDDHDVPVPQWRARSLATVGPDDEVEAVLAAMQRDGAHLALVVDGGRQIGVVFLEDILEELVGEVRDAMQRADDRP
ncbi:HlyC/CorC family transporter [Flavimobilis sp. GY10621]|uniref:HlyC/CorC family transporter n=1 Tax=Flavimobilis rhizosphaerae TaxID=2775421 RepID=A0ABR9DQ33_9MICO|nr:hemolysin family protein [Flavimobilis rhizosphaerae]MBD9698442.1 HlyC/CorC family transporter [Flavimobilis rhizosphaerae]